VTIVLSPQENLCLSKDITHVNVGGGEPAGISAADCATYVRRVRALVAEYGKKLMGWQEVSGAAAHGGKTVMPPIFVVYLDMGHTADISVDPVGDSWAGCLDVKDMCDWDSETVRSGVPADAASGVSASMFTELAYSSTDIQELACRRRPSSGAAAGRT